MIKIVLGSDVERKITSLKRIVYRDTYFNDAEIMSTYNVPEKWSGGIAHANAIKDLFQLIYDLL